MAKLKWDHFYGGLPKQLKAMVTCLKATPDKKTYSDYFCAAWEDEKEEAMKPSHSHMADMASKPKVTSFFPFEEAEGHSPF